MKFLNEIQDLEFIVNELPRIGDILAISFVFPFFVYYFYIIKTVLRSNGIY